MIENYRVWAKYSPKSQQRSSTLFDTVAIYLAFSEELLVMEKLVTRIKILIQQRFKGVGMRWSETGFNHLLHLRLAWVNGRFDELFALEDSPN